MTMTAEQRKNDFLEYFVNRKVKTRKQCQGYYKPTINKFSGENNLDEEAKKRKYVQNSFFELDSTQIEKVEDLHEWACKNTRTIIHGNPSGVLSQYIDYLTEYPSGFTGSSSSTGVGTPMTNPTKTVAKPAAAHTPLNLILYGPPGTGKTYHTIDEALKILEPGTNWTVKSREDRQKAFDDYRDNKKRIVFTTFHQSMSYEDFIEGIKPDLGTPTIAYKIEDGIFKTIANLASNDLDDNYVLIIDEINRGNIANIFGELITLIEENKRAGNSDALSVTLPYSKKPFSVPKNLYIIGTMNTADRSVEALDSALRRRFIFKEMMPQPEFLKNVKVTYGPNPGDNVMLEDLLKTLNDRIEILKDREHQIGHSYFMNFAAGATPTTPKTIKAEDLLPVFKNSIIPLLQEYFYGDYEKIQLILGEGFIESKKPAVTFAKDGDDVDLPEEMYAIVPDPKMEPAIKTMLGKK